MKYCHDRGGRLPDEEESLAVVQGLFYNAATGDKNDHPGGSSWDSATYKINTELTNSIGITNWDGSSITESNFPYDIYLPGPMTDMDFVYSRIFNANRTQWGIRPDGNNLIIFDPQLVLCISD